MSVRRVISSALMLGLAACNQVQTPAVETGASSASEENLDAFDEARPELPPVDAALLEAPNSAFTAIEPTEIGVIGSPDIREALAPLLSVEAMGEGEGESVELSVREAGDTAVADVVRTGMADDSVAGGHVRVEFRREEDGWFPTNAYRRQQCRRGADPGAWTTELCP